MPIMAMHQNHGYGLSVDPSVTLSLIAGGLPMIPAFGGEELREDDSIGGDSWEAELRSQNDSLRPRFCLKFEMCYFSRFILRTDFFLV